MPRPIRSQYEDFMRHVFERGVAKSDRTGTGTRSVFGHQMRFDLNDGFPAQAAPDPIPWCAGAERQAAGYAGAAGA